MDLYEKARSLPSSPGVYLYKDAEGQVIYVGKAKDLRARVRTYLQEEQWQDAKTGTLLREAADLEFVVVDTESEALALENTLIKRLQPRFNILLRDDKTYPYIRLSSETYPRVYVTRRLEQDGSEYFGPYFPAGFAYRLVHFIHKHFLVPSCRIDLTRNHPRPCLQYHIHRCLGPCVAGLTTREDYQQAVEDVRLFLANRQTDLARGLRLRRDTAAEAERYEEAASYRDLLTVLEEMHARQKMHAVGDHDADIVGVHVEGKCAALYLFHLRHGRIVDRREFFWEDLPEEDRTAVEQEAKPAASSEARLLNSVLGQIYLHQPYVPPLILTPVEFHDRELLQLALAKQRGGVVEIAVPQRGPKRAMLELAQKNALHAFARRFRADGGKLQVELGRELATALHLPAPPERIECFDISHFQGAETVASMVVWEGGSMRKSAYRKYRIRTLNQVDDFRAIAEVVERRYKRVVEGRLDSTGGSASREAEMPDLVLIDGGLGQLHAAAEVLAKLGLEAQPLASIAKKEEIVYVAGHEDKPLRLETHSPVRQLMQHIRDEAHRFAITFHRQRRDKGNLRSALLEAPGVGTATVRKLLRHFGSLNAVETADATQLGTVLPSAKAQDLWRYLHQEGGGKSGATD